jgi:hypothetical protein
VAAAATDVVAAAASAEPPAASVATVTVAITKAAVATLPASRRGASRLHAELSTWR